MCHGLTRWRRHMAAGPHLCLCAAQLGCNRDRLGATLRAFDQPLYWPGEAATWRQRCGRQRLGCRPPGTPLQHAQLVFVRCPLQDEPADPLMVFAEALRSKGGVENRSGVLNGERVELFRGKDLVRWVKAHPAKCAAAAAGERHAVAASVACLWSD